MLRLSFKLSLSFFLCAIIIIFGGISLLSLSLSLMLFVCFIIIIFGNSLFYFFFPFPSHSLFLTPWFIEVCWSVSQYVCQFVFICLFFVANYRGISSSVCCILSLSVILSTLPSLCLSIFLPFSVWLFIFLSVCLSVYFPKSFCLLIFPSLCVSGCQSMSGCLCILYSSVFVFLFPSALVYLSLHFLESVYFLSAFITLCLSVSIFLNLFLCFQSLQSWSVYLSVSAFLKSLSVCVSTFLSLCLSSCPFSLVSVSVSLYLFSFRHSLSAFLTLQKSFLINLSQRL